MGPEPPSSHRSSLHGILKVQIPASLHLKTPHLYHRVPPLPSSLCPGPFWQGGRVRGHRVAGATPWGRLGVTGPAPARSALTSSLLLPPCGSGVPRAGVRVTEPPCGCGYRGGSQGTPPSPVLGAPAHPSSDPPHPSFVFLRLPLLPGPQGQDPACRTPPSPSPYPVPCLWSGLPHRHPSQGLPQAGAPPSPTGTSDHPTLCRCPWHWETGVVTLGWSRQPGSAPAWAAARASSLRAGRALGPLNPQPQFPRCRMRGCAEGCWRRGRV